MNYLPSIIAIALFIYCLMFESKAIIWRRKYEDLQRSIREGTYEDR